MAKKIPYRKIIISLIIPALALFFTSCTGAKKETASVAPIPAELLFPPPPPPEKGEGLWHINWYRPPKKVDPYIIAWEKEKWGEQMAMLIASRRRNVAFNLNPKTEWLKADAILEGLPDYVEIRRPDNLNGETTLFVDKTAIAYTLFDEAGGVVLRGPVSYQNSRISEGIPTPSGTFYLNPGSFVENRPWHKEGIPGGAPSNPLGPFWITIRGGVGMHGTTQLKSGPPSVGSATTTHGCIRTLPEDNYAWWHYLLEVVKSGKKAKVVISF